MENDSFFINLLHSIWNGIKKFFRILLNFFKDIVSFFKDPSRLKKLKEQEDVIAVSIKEKLSSGDYNIVNCLFDKDTSTIVDMSTDCVGIAAEDLDSEAKMNFADKAMIILE